MGAILQLVPVGLRHVPVDDGAIGLRDLAVRDARRLHGIVDIDALAALEHADDKGFGHKDWIAHDPDFESIRETPRFKVILDGM